METGIRGAYFGRLNSSISVWSLELDSELVCVGDAGTTDPEISYFYASCLPGDPAISCGAGLPVRAGADDVHLHPVEPRALRATLRYRFWRKAAAA